MTLSTVLILYVVGMAITFILAPIVMDIKKPEDLIFASIIFPLFWIVTIPFYVFMWTFKIAEMYIDFLEKRNEK